MIVGMMGRLQSIGKKTSLPCYNDIFLILVGNFITIAQKFKDSLCLKIDCTFVVVCSIVMSLCSCDFA